MIELYNASARGDLAYCAIEIEHLHNIPSLIDEGNIFRHRYYLQKERPYYLKRLKKLPNYEVSFCLQRYRELWPLLRKYLR